MTIIPGKGVAFQGNKLLFRVKDPVYVGVASVNCVIGQAVTLALEFSNSGTSAVYTAENLPTDLSIHPATGVITGIVTGAVRTVTSVVSCRNKRSTKLAVITWYVTAVVANVPVITSPAEYSGIGGQAFAYQITGNYLTAEYGTVSYAKVSGYASATVNTSTGAITLPGNIWPSAGLASTTITVKATNTNGDSANHVITLSATAAPLLPPGPVTPNSLTFQEDIAITPVQLVSANVDPVTYPLTDYIYWQGSTPSGLSLSYEGLLTGTPTTPAVSNFYFEAGNAAGEGSLTPATITITAAPQPPVINSALTLTVNEDANFAYAISATNSPTSYGATIPGTLNATRSGNIISGNEETPGTYNIPITATNGAGTDSETLVLTVASLVNPPVISSPTSVTGTVGVYGEWQIVATNSPTAYSVGGNVLASIGITCDPDTGLISGTPTEAAEEVEILTAQNAGGSGYAYCTFTFNPSSPWNVKNASSATLTAPMVLTNNEYVSQPTGGASPGTSGKAVFPFTIPTGEGGRYYVKLNVNAPSTAANSIWIDCNAVPLAAYRDNIFPTTGAQDRVITYLEAEGSETGTSNPNIWTLSQGANTVQICGLDPNVKVYSVSLIREVTPSGVAASNLNGQAGVAFTSQMSASGYPLSWSSSGLPAWATLNASTGLITGTPTAPGTPSFTVTATNPTGSSAAFTVNLTIAAGAVPSIVTTTASGTANGFSFQIVATGNPTSYNATSLPSGASVNTTTGVVTFGNTVTAGSYSITLSATNASGTGSGSCSVTVTAAYSSLPVARTPGGLGSWSFAGASIDAGRTQYGATLPSGSSRAAVVAALAACPDGRAVVLAAGAYNWEGNPITITRNNVTLRGAGPGTTIIYGGVWVGDSSVWYAVTQNTALQGRVAWTAGFTQGTTDITVADASGFSVGQLIMLDQLNDEYTSQVQYEDENAFTGRYTSTSYPADGRDRALHQTNRITAKVGNVLTLADPLFITYNSGLSPQVWRFSTQPTVGVGIENLTMQDNAPNRIACSYNCWIVNCQILAYLQSQQLASGITQIQWSGHCTFRTLTVAIAGGSANDWDMYGIEGICSSSCRIEDCLTNWIGVGIQISGFSGSVFGYNYIANTKSGGTGDYFALSFLNHGGFPWMNLIEGNMASTFMLDNTDGPSGYNVIHRNWLKAKPDLGTPYKNIVAVSVNTRNYHCAIIGNVLGTAGETYYARDDAPTDQKGIYALGWEGPVERGRTFSTFPDVHVATLATLIRGYNYDEKTVGIFENGISAGSVPASYDHASAPAFMSGYTWPPIDPAQPTASRNAARIPAGYRYTNGIDP